MSEVDRKVGIVYYPFGLEMEGRDWSDTTASSYRHAFNGKERDGNGEWGNVAYDYGFRIYDPVIARFKSVDPLTANFAYYSPYQFAGNKPIMFIDLDGAEFQIPTFEKFKYGDNPAVNVVTVVDNVVVDGVNGGIGLVNSGIYAIHKIFTNPTSIPNEIKSETGALVSETGKYFEGQYNYITKTPVKQQLVDTYEGFKDPESYEAPLEFATGLFLTRNFKVPGSNTAKAVSDGFAELAKSGTINPFKVRFSQGSIKGMFKDGGSIDDLVKGLKAGTIDPKSVAPIRIVEKDGKIFTLDNRRLKAFQDAGVDIPYQKLDEIPENELFKFKDYDAGKTDGTTVKTRGQK